MIFNNLHFSCTANYKGKTCAFVELAHTRRNNDFINLPSLWLSFLFLPRKCLPNWSLFWLPSSSSSSTWWVCVFLSHMLGAHSSSSFSSSPSISSPNTHSTGKSEREPTTTTPPPNSGPLNLMSDDSIDHVLLPLFNGWFLLQKRGGEWDRRRPRYLFSMSCVWEWDDWLTLRFNH